MANRPLGKALFCGQWLISARRQVDCISKARPFGGECESKGEAMARLSPRDSQLMPHIIHTSNCFCDVPGLVQIVVASVVQQ